LHESCCVIVGAGPGLGLNVARRFAQGGFNIALISRDQSKLDGLTETLNSEGYTAQGFAADAAIEQELQSAFSRITQWNGDIGALVYNASAMIPDNLALTLSLRIIPSWILFKARNSRFGAPAYPLSA
jgi:short-subunit dehydrogenase